jgi:hypothetical protein
MAKSAVERYSSMAEMAAALTDYLRATNKPAPAAAAAPVPETTQPLPPPAGAERSPFADLTPAGSAPPAAQQPRSTAPRSVNKRWSMALGMGLGTGRWRWSLTTVIKYSSLSIAIALLPGIPAVSIIYQRTNYGTIKIELINAPKEVEVKIDGNAVEVTGLGEPWRFVAREHLAEVTGKEKVGRHLLEVRGKDVETHSESFTLKRGDNPVLKVTLLPEPPTGVLVVTVNEASPEVYVDGEKVAVTWADGGKRAEIRVKPGTHKVEVKKDGFDTVTREIELKTGKAEKIPVRLVPSANCGFFMREGISSKELGKIGSRNGRMARRPTHTRS